MNALQKTGLAQSGVFASRRAGGGRRSTLPKLFNGLLADKERTF